MPNTLYNNNFVFEISINFRDKYLKEYRVKNTNISILKKSKIASHSYPDIKHLHLTPKANLTEKKQPSCSTRANISLDSLLHSNTNGKTYRKFMIPIYKLMRGGGSMRGLSVRWHVS